MKLILKNRGGGKTMDLIKESIETAAYIAMFRGPRPGQI